VDVKVIPYGQELGRVVYRLNTFNKGLEQSQLSCGGYGDIGSISATVNSKAVMIRGGFDRGCEDGSFNRGLRWKIISFHFLEKVRDGCERVFYCYDRRG